MQTPDTSREIGEESQIRSSASSRRHSFRFGLEALNSQASATPTARCCTSSRSALHLHTSGDKRHDEPRARVAPVEYVRETYHSRCHGYGVQAARKSDSQTATQIELVLCRVSEVKRELSSRQAPLRPDTYRCTCARALEHPWTTCHLQQSVRSAYSEAHQHYMNCPSVPGTTYCHLPQWNLLRSCIAIECMCSPNAE